MSSNRLCNELEWVLWPSWKPNKFYFRILLGNCGQSVFLLQFLLFAGFLYFFLFFLDYCIFFWTFVFVFVLFSLVTAPPVVKWEIAQKWTKQIALTVTENNIKERVLSFGCLNAESDLQEGSTLWTRNDACNKMWRKHTYILVCMYVGVYIKACCCLRMLHGVFMLIICCCCRLNHTRWIQLKRVIYYGSNEKWSNFVVIPHAHRTTPQHTVTHTITHSLMYCTYKFFFVVLCWLYVIFWYQVQHSHLLSSSWSSWNCRFQVEVEVLLPYMLHVCVFVCVWSHWRAVKISAHYENKF